MVYMSAFCALAAQLLAHLFGGILRNSLGPQVYCKPIGFCHGIMNCVQVCPKGLNPTKAIGHIRNMLIRSAT